MWLDETWKRVRGMHLLSHAFFSEPEWQYENTRLFCAWGRMQGDSPQVQKVPAAAEFVEDAQES